jgi:hypothetical protein
VSAALVEQINERTKQLGTLNPGNIEEYTRIASAVSVHSGGLGEWRPTLRTPSGNTVIVVQQCMMAGPFACRGAACSLMAFILAWYRSPRFCTLLALACMFWYPPLSHSHHGCTLHAMQTDKFCITTTSMQVIALGGMDAALRDRKSGAPLSTEADLQHVWGAFLNMETSSTSPLSAAASVKVLRELGGQTLPLLRAMLTLDIDSMPSLSEVVSAVKADMRALGEQAGLAQQVRCVGPLQVAMTAARHSLHT